MKKSRIYILSLMVILAVSSCIPRRQTLYLQDLSTQKDYQNRFDSLTTITEKYVLKPNDYLYVRVFSIDPKISEFFNPTGGSNSSSGGQAGGRMFSYLIDDNMNIDFPFAGYINLAGCNLTQAKAKISKALEPYLKEAILNVKLSNNSFTALGEVRSPGIKTMEKDQVTIFEALGLMGDLTPYAKRKKVVLLRQTEKGAVTYEIDLRDKNIVNSDFYYIYPNDFIYVKPMAAKTWGIGENFSLGLLTTTVAAYFMITQFIK